MKKVLFLLCLIAILSACNQSESVTLIQEETPEIGSRAKVEENQQPNVYVEEVVETYGYVCKLLHLYYLHTKAHYHRQPF